MKAGLSPRWFMGKVCPECRVWVAVGGSSLPQKVYQTTLDHFTPGVVITLPHLVTPFGTCLRKKTVPPLRPGRPNVTGRSALPPSFGGWGSGPMVHVMRLMDGHRWAPMMAVSFHRTLFYTSSGPGYEQPCQIHRVWLRKRIRSC